MTLPSQVVDIDNGTIEYATTGKGPVVLISHGTLGGYDQGLAVASLFNLEKFSFLAVSRAGYLRSSPESGRTPEEQAHSYIALLDRLAIPSAAVLGLSGGGPAALRFAQDYPDRCWALVLISAYSAAPPPLPPHFRLIVRLQDFTMRMDPLWKLMYRYGLGLSLRMNGVRPDQIKAAMADPEKREFLNGIFRSVTTASQRLQGVRLDGTQLEGLPREASYHINVPVFISHAANDPLAPVAGAAQLAGLLSQARYLEMPDGGHVFFVIHRQQVIPAIELFLTQVCGENIDKI